MCLAVKKCVKFEDSNRAIPRNLQAVPLYWLHTILKILSNTWKFVTFYDEKVKQNFKPRTLNLYTQTYFRTPVCLNVGMPIVSIQKTKPHKRRKKIRNWL